MHSSLGKPTRKQQRYFQQLQQLGCVCCRLIGIAEQPCEMHHPLRAGKRISHDDALGLCPWHHRAVPIDGRTLKQMNDIYGPSLIQKRDFVAAFGDESYLLECQDALLKKYVMLSTVTGNEDGH